MKTFALLLTLTLVQLFSELSQAYILPIETILNKTVATASAGILSIEQNVIFKEAGKDYIIKEEWLIEGDKNLKLTATGLGELKDLFKVTYLYNNKTRSFLKGKNKITSEIAKDFFEKYLAIKSTASYLAYLQNMNVSQKVSYSRAAGSICFAIGEAATPTLSPAQIWIDQDLFQLKKMRFNSTAEVEFADYKLYEKTYYPTRKIISVNDDSVNINVIKVALANSASIKDFYPESLSSPSEINLSSKEAVGLKIENFYTRFR